MAWIRENLAVDYEALPTKKQLGKELGEFLRNGLGRSLPGDKTAKDVQALSDLSRELAADPSEDWPMRIARVVLDELGKIRQKPERLAIADMLGVDLDDRSIEDAIEGIESGEAVAALELAGGRYEQAGQRFRAPKRKKGYAERYVKDTLRKQWLERIAERLLERAEEGRQALSQDSEPVPTVIAKEQDPVTAFADDNPTKPPILLVGAVGVVLVLTGVVWLVAVATGAIS